MKALREFESHKEVLQLIYEGNKDLSIKGGGNKCIFFVETCSTVTFILVAMRTWNLTSYSGRLDDRRDGVILLKCVYFTLLTVC